jgi:excisionase family DNA binding protein
MVEKLSQADKSVEPTIWTVHDVAVYLRMSDAKVYRLIKDKRIPVARIGKAWRFRKDLVDEWLSRSAALSMHVDGE